MKKIRNTRHVALLVPSLHLHVLPGGETRIADDVAVPDGFELVGPLPAPKPPTVAQLKERAAELHVEVPKGARRADLEALVTAAEHAAAADTEPAADADASAGEPTDPQAATDDEPTHEETNQ